VGHAERLAELDEAQKLYTKRVQTYIRKKEKRGLKHRPSSTVEVGRKDTHLHAVLPVSTSQAKGFASPALSLRGKLSCIHRRVTNTRRCGEVGGFVSGCDENFDLH
jgi:hypothetical protein